MTPLQRFLAGEKLALLVEPDGQQRGHGPKVPALLAGSFNPLHDGHLSMAEAAAKVVGAPVSFELCICNVDKPSLTADEVSLRLQQFAWRHPVWLTRTPTFVEKAALFPGALFVVGVDTAERIFAARYYAGAEAGLTQAFHALRERGCRFLVAARRDSRGVCVRLPDLAIPPGFRDLFQELPETVFRLDISSTQLRQP